MFRKSFKYILLIFLVVLLPLGSCGTKQKAVKAQKQFDKRMEQRKREGEKALKAGKERHYQIQEKDVQDRMKETRRKSQRLGKNKKEPFYNRWYRSIKQKVTSGF
jgi:Flp pilus assembly protein TadB